MLEVLVRSNNVRLVAKLISKFISKIYKTPKFMIHILKLKTYISHSFGLPHPYPVFCAPHRRDQRWRHPSSQFSTVSPADLETKSVIFYPGINFSFQFRSQRILQMVRAWRISLFFPATSEQCSRKKAIKSLKRTSQNLTFLFMKVTIWRQLHLFIKLFPCQQKAWVNIQLTCYVAETQIKEYGLKKLFEKMFFPPSPIQKTI